MPSDGTQTSVVLSLNLFFRVPLAPPESPVRHILRFRGHHFRETLPHEGWRIGNMEFSAPAWQVH